MGFDLDRLGHMDEMHARRDAILRGCRISQAARARIMGRPRWLPPAKSHTVTVDCARPEERKIEKGAPPVTTEPVKAVAIEARPPGVTIAAVQWVFLDELWSAGYRVGKTRRFMRDDLVCKARARCYSWPRHVCIDLVRRICPGPVDGRVSTPAIGRVFGSMDHSSVLHALKQAPKHLAEWPVLAVVHAKVRVHFEEKK